MTQTTDTDRTDFQQSEHVTHTLAPPITDLNGAYGVVPVNEDEGP